MPSFTVESGSGPGIKIIPDPCHGWNRATGHSTRSLYNRFWHETVLQTFQKFRYEIGMVPTTGTFNIRSLEVF
jgi:hypothetical protein